ncbi:MAG: hypothetical protein ACJ8AC_06460 [Gemmatimonadaceae bacterium]
MTGYRRWLTASFTVVASLMPFATHAQKAIKPSDLAGTWEEIASKNLKTGAVDSLASHGVNWVQFTRSRWMAIEMENGRKATSAADFRNLSPQEKINVNYAKVWDDKNTQIFAARGGTYKLAGNVMHTTRSVALQPATVGLNETFTVVRFDRNTLVLRTPPDGEGIAYEVTLRRLE